MEAATHQDGSESGRSGHRRQCDDKLRHQQKHLIKSGPRDLEEDRSGAHLRVMTRSCVSVPSDGAIELAAWIPALTLPRWVGEGAATPLSRAWGKGTLSTGRTGYQRMASPITSVPIFAHFTQLRVLAQSQWMDGEPHGHSVLSLSLLPGHVALATLHSMNQALRERPSLTKPTMLSVLGQVWGQTRQVAPREGWPGGLPREHSTTPFVPSWDTGS